MHWVLEPFRRVLDYSGRSRRREYWLFILTSAISFVAYGAVAPGGAAIHVNAVETTAAPQGGIWSLLSVLVVLMVLLPGLAVTVRRLHDIDRSGLWITLPFAPTVFWAVALVGGFSSEVLFRLVIMVIVIAPIAFVVMMGLRGTSGPNRYGPDPKDREREMPFPADADAQVRDPK